MKQESSSGRWKFGFGIRTYFSGYLLIGFCVLLTGCESAKQCVAPKPPNSAWIQTELFFGLTTQHGVPIPESQWAAFLDHNITPRFPDGLTVLAADGRWKDTNQVLHAEQSRLVIILYPTADAYDVDKRIRALTSEYIKQFDQESVLRSDSEESTTFYVPNKS